MKVIVCCIVIVLVNMVANGIPGKSQAIAGEMADPVHNDLFETVPPQLTDFAPASRRLPENALRVYLTFSQPMRRHQVARLIRLTDDNGIEIENPFLNLHVELWDQSQQRLTLLFDPGRIKRGVGPNVQAGAPLRAGRTYRLVVSARMKSAQGVEIGKDETVEFVVIAADRKPVNPSAWRYSLPAAGSLESLEIVFDRIMDSPIAKRLISVRTAGGERIKGHITASDSQWRFTALERWKPGKYLFEVHHDFEDAAGNRLRVAFDQRSLTGQGLTKDQDHVETPHLSLEFEITPIHRIE